MGWSPRPPSITDPATLRARADRATAWSPAAITPGELRELADELERLQRAVRTSRRGMAYGGC